MLTLVEAAAIEGISTGGALVAKERCAWSPGLGETIARLEEWPPAVAARTVNSKGTTWAQWQVHSVAAGTAGMGVARECAHGDGGAMAGEGVAMALGLGDGNTDGVSMMKSRHGGASMGAWAWAGAVVRERSGWMRWPEPVMTCGGRRWHSAEVHGWHDI